MTLDLPKLRALAEAATPGPWFFAYSRIVSEPISREYDRIERTFPDDIADDDPRWDTLPEPDVAYVTPSYGDTATGPRAADAAFIAASRTAIPALLDRVEELQRECERLRGDRDSYANSDFERQLAESRTEVARLRKIFDDAGLGEHNVLALIEHYQDEERKACHERDALITRRDELLALVASISQTVPLESEVSEALAQRGALLAEVGTLRAKLDYERRHAKMFAGAADTEKAERRIVEIDRNEARAKLTTTEHERDAYRSMLADLVFARKRAAMGEAMPADLWARARDLLKHGPNAKGASDE